jgi:hypothetical protein
MVYAENFVCTLVNREEKLAILALHYFMQAMYYLWQRRITSRLASLLFYLIYA